MSPEPAPAQNPAPSPSGPPSEAQTTPGPSEQADAADPGGRVAPVSYPDLGAGAEPGEPAGLDRLADVQLTVSVELGRATMRMRDLLALNEGSVVDLDRVPGTPVDVLVNGSLVARGDVVVVGEELGVRINSLER